MKIVQAVNAMIANSDKINNVIAPRVSGVLFFQYDFYKWSIAKGDDDTVLTYYPTTDATIEEIAASQEWLWGQAGPIVSYSARDLNTREAWKSFGELHRIVSEKVYGVDNVLDSIINDLPF